MYCIHCGAEVPESAAFCPGCGGRLTAPAGKERSRRLSPRMKRLLCILGGAAAVILVLMLVLFAVNRHRHTVDLGEIPDPEAFFGLSAVHHDWGRDGYQHEITFESDQITHDGVLAYVELLKDDAYPFVLDETIPFPDGMVRYVFCYSGEKELYDAEEWQILVEYDPGRKVGYAQVSIRNSENFLIVPAGAFASGDPSPSATATAAPSPTPVATPSPTPTPTPQPEAPSVLPDFLAHDASDSFRMGTTSSDRVLAFIAESDSVRYVADNYVRLLLDMGYYISDTEEKSYLYRWYLTHDDVGGSTVAGSAQVCVKHMTYTTFDKAKTEISITFGSGVTYAGETMTGSGGSSGSSGSSGNTRQPCSICNRTGDCRTCGGDGYLWSSAADKENRNCYSCRNHNGKCTYCNGTGWRD